MLFSIRPRREETEKGERGSGRTSKLRIRVLELNILTKYQMYRKP